MMQPTSPVVEEAAENAVLDVMEEDEEKNLTASLIKINLQEVKLNEAENPWKPGTINAKGKLTEEEEKTLLLLKEFRGILNKITPGNLSLLNKLMDEVKLLEINTVIQLYGCVSLVFEKAISEPKFALGYALMCKEISGVFVVDVETAGNKIQKTMFKNRLIKNCQLEFEKLEVREFLKNQCLEEIENEEDPTKKRALEQAFEEENFKLHLRAVGTVQFIGELFKIDMLTSKIMVHCIVMLMDHSWRSEETLECLCKLLSTIGKQLEKMDNDKKENDLTPTFNALKNIADKKQLNKLQISSRIRFMIQDVIDLRLNNWMPRLVETMTKTIVQIEKEAEFDYFMCNFFRKEGNNRGSRGKFNDKRVGGWSTQQGKNSRPVPLDFNKMAPVASGGAEIKLGSSAMFQNFMTGPTDRFNVLDECE